MDDREIRAAPLKITRRTRAGAARGRIAERVERLREEPGLVLDELAEMRSVWNAADVEREVRSMLGVRDDQDAAVSVAMQAISEASLRLDVDAYTLERVVVEERAVFDAATTLADRRRDVALRESAAELDVQQQAAYAHLAGERDLAIVSGIAGAGKSRLQRDVAAAYEEAGYRVIGAAVAGDAARTLGEEAAIEARTVANCWQISRRGAIGSIVVAF